MYQRSAFRMPCKAVTMSRGNIREGVELSGKLYMARS